MKKSFEHAEVGEKFVYNNFVYLKLSEINYEKPYWNSDLKTSIIVL